MPVSGKMAQSIKCPLWKHCEQEFTAPPHTWCLVPGIPVLGVGVEQRQNNPRHSLGRQPSQQGALSSVRDSLIS